MTIQPRSSFTKEPSPLAEVGRDKAVILLLSNADFFYTLVDSVRSAEAKGAISAPADIVHFFRTLIHAEGSEQDHKDRITGLALLDNALVDRRAETPSYRNLADKFSRIKTKILAELDGHLKHPEADFDEFVRKAQFLAVSPGFQAYSKEILITLKAENVSIRLKELTQVQDLITTRSRELQAEIELDNSWLEEGQQKSIADDDHLQQLLGIRDRLGGPWLSRRYPTPLAEVDGRVAFR